MGGRGVGRLRSGGGYGGGGNEGGRGMSKRGSAAKRGGSRFLSAEDEERLRANVIRRNSLREDGSETDAKEVLVETVGGNAGNESVVDRVRRLEEVQGGQAKQAVLAVPQVEQMVVIEEARRDEFDFGRRMTVISVKEKFGKYCGEDQWTGTGCGECQDSDSRWAKDHGGGNRGGDEWHVRCDPAGEGG